ncbi:MAG: outer rane immunogenic protein [Alphaproteobacteria bacterium]|nr:outer rane immunogenic protein [Alphaproteobacteria bacterium]
MRKTLLAIITLGAFASGSAMAADLPVRAPAYKAPVIAPVVSNWTGFYIGVHVGADRFDKDWFVPLTPINIAGGCPGCPAANGGHRDNSWLAGGQIGFNYQVGAWVLGVEAQASATDLEGSNLSAIPAFGAAGIRVNSKTDSVGTVAARLGWALGGQTLLYVKGGGAWAHDKFWTSTAAFPIAQSVTDTRSGWVVGVGAEFAMSGNWSIKVEYNHMDFGNRTETLGPVAIGTAPFQYNVDQTIDLVKVGINYRFGGPVVAAY